MVEPPFQWQVVRAQLDPIRGSEQGGERPVLVVSREVTNEILPVVAVLPLTTARRRVYPTEVLLPAGVAGHPQDSIVMAHQIRVLAKERLLHSYGWLNDGDLRERVRAAMQVYLDLR